MTNMIEIYRRQDVLWQSRLRRCTGSTENSLINRMQLAKMYLKLGNITGTTSGLDSRQEGYNRIKCRSIASLASFYAKQKLWDDALADIRTPH